MNPSQNTITQLALVAKTKSGYREGILYAGWSAGGVPVLTTSSDNLAGPAIKSLDAIRASGIQLQTVNVSSLIAFDFNYVGTLYDFADTSSISLTEDVIDIGLVDTNGHQTALRFGELQLLNALSSSVLKWQYVPTAGTSALVVKAVNSFSLVVLGKRGKVEGDILIIFKPILAERGNEIEFSSFVRDVIGRLIALDEQQKPELKKGYLLASTGGPEKKSFWDAFVAPSADGRHFEPGKALLKGLDKIGLIDIRGMDLDDKKNLIKQGLDKVELPQLIQVAQTMLKQASMKVK